MNRGFSLLELAIVIAISGLMVGFVAQTSQASKSTDCYASTRLQVNTIHDAIESFVRKNDRYPLPAQRNIGVNDPNFGREAIASNITQAAGVSFGALPFVALGLPTSYAGDCWGNKFSYVVTTALTTNASTGGYLDPTVNGNIQVFTGYNAAGTAPNYSSNTAAFAVISHGADAYGAVALNYSNADAGWCSGGGFTLKAVNCNANSNVVANAILNNGKDAGSKFFDDVVLASDRARILVTGPLTSNAYCWGKNSGGQIGNNVAGGPSIKQLTPANVSGTETYVSILANESAATQSGHTCALNAAGIASCWGSNSRGELGNGTTTNSAVPVTVSGGPYTAIAVGGMHSCALNGAGDAYCWGNGLSGILGDGNPSPATNNPTPVAVTKTTGAPAFVAIAAGDATNCAVSAAGQGWCWGYNATGAVGDGTTTNRASPVQLALPGGALFSQIKPSYKHTCALDTTGKAYCWGYNANGELGNGTTTQSLSPVAASNDTLGNPLAFALIATGTTHTCGLTAAGTAYCWGQNGYGQLGDGSTNPSLVPIKVNTALVFRKLVGGYFRTCGITAAGQSYCWGYNTSGQIGNGIANTSVNTSLTLATGSGTSPMVFGDIATGSSSLHTCALTRVPCALPWGGYINDGSGVLAYRAATPDAFGPCTSETRTCSNGVLSGTYTYQSCSGGCSGGTVMWNGAASGCQSSVGAMTDGQSTIITNTLPGFGGSLTVTCTAGAWVNSSATCTAGGEEM